MRLKLPQQSLKRGNWLWKEAQLCFGMYPSVLLNGLNFKGKALAALQRPITVHQDDGNGEVAHVLYKETHFEAFLQQLVQVSTW